MSSIQPYESLRAGEGTFRCSVARTGTCWDIRITGDADASNVAELERSAHSVHLDFGSVLTVDLTAAAYIGSSVVRWLVELEHWAAAQSAMLVVLVAHGEVEATLRLTGADRKLALVPIDGAGARLH